MKRGRRRRRPGRQRRADGGATGVVADVVADLQAHRETGPRLTGGDVDADWHGAWDAGDEAVGGSTATPDQDVVDELGEALGVPQAPDAEVQTSAEILADRDRHRWTLEREVEREARDAENEEDE
jgi:hypothetical protein